MVSFDHRDRGTLESEWLADERFTSLRSIDPDPDVLVVLAAHPDDETLGAAALMAMSARRGARLIVVVATDGEGSHPESSTVTPERLASVRRREVTAAVRSLAPDAVIEFLGLPDGALREERLDLSGRLAAILDAAVSRAARPLLVAPWRGDGHRDHRIAGEVAAELAGARDIDLFEYPIWLWHWSAPGDAAMPWDRLRVLPVGDGARAAKRTALAEHHSQAEPLSELPGDEAVLGAEMQRHFDRPFETFVVAERATTTGVTVSSPSHDASPAPSLGAEFFDEFYEGRSDPWGFETRWYEARKRAITLAALPDERYGDVLEIGCSTGVLSAELAMRADRLLAVDISEAPLERARERLAGRDDVRFERHATPREWPTGLFDLIVLSEVGYYWGPADLETAIDHTLASLAPDGVLLTCHWRHEVPEYPLDGDRVHAAIGARDDLVRIVSHVEEDFLLEVFTRPPARSVARRTGLVS
ncbi:PIG-L family deacetylase [Plantibacter sp. YIM 135249]|uniref:PIG-L family deacetylase n=1 Tax=Plantibacter sp. YIM 135249 TaxID=3423918 RepID=UPI003D3399D8